MDVSGFEQGAGGGSFEIAGITEAHHSRATEFKSDIERTRELEGLRGSLTGQSLNDLDSSIGQAYEDLENEILDYLEKYTNDAENFFNPDCPLDCEVKCDLEYMIRDAVFNRGPTGARYVTQYATGSKADGKLGPGTRSALENLGDDYIDRMYNGRKQYEINHASFYAKHRDGLRSGIINRWDKVKNRVNRT